MSLRAKLCIGVVAALLIVPPGRVGAEPAAEEALEDPGETTAREVAGAPRPGDASGVAVPEAPSLRERLMVIPRAILFVPWIVTELAFVPVRTLAYGAVRFQVGTRLARLPLNHTGKAALYPIAALESGYGADAGIMLVGRDLFGGGERIAGQVRIGHRIAEGYRVDADSGHRLGPVALVAGAMYERRARAAFYGIGANDVRDAGEVTVPVDPTGAEAVEARYGLRTRRAHGGLRLALPGGIELTGLGARVDHELRDADAPQPDLGIYDTAGLAGLEPLEHYELSGAVTWRAWSSGVALRPRIYPDSGVRVRALVTRTLAMPAPARDYTRIGGDLGLWLGVLGGGRVLALRAAVETVTAPVGEVPFYELPALGGPGRLRGLRRDRFRDRAAAMVGLEYRFLVEDDVALAAFAEAGTVAGSVTDLGGGGALGFGLELSVFGRRTEYLRAQLGSSTEGALIVNVLLLPEVP